MTATTAEEYVEIAKTNEIANRQMKHVEVRGKEILIANIDWKFYALNDRCGHMNALLSMGNLANDSIVTCLSMEQDLILLLVKRSKSLF